MKAKSDIRNIFLDTHFGQTKDQKGMETWNSFREAVEKYLGNVKDPNYNKYRGKIQGLSITR